MIYILISVIVLTLIYTVLKIKVLKRIYKSDYLTKREKLKFYFLTTCTSTGVYLLNIRENNHHKNNEQLFPKMSSLEFRK